MKIAALLTAATAAATTTVVSGSFLRDPKTVTQKDRTLSETERRLAVSVCSCKMTPRMTLGYAE